MTEPITSLNDTQILETLSTIHDDLEQIAQEAEEQKHNAGRVADAIDDIKARAQSTFDLIDRLLEQLGQYEPPRPNQCLTCGMLVDTTSDDGIFFHQERYGHRPIMPFSNPTP